MLASLVHELRIRQLLRRRVVVDLAKVKLDRLVATSTSLIDVSTLVITKLMEGVHLLAAAYLVA